jgi:hypothetical protein
MCGALSIRLIISCDEQEELLPDCSTRVEEERFFHQQEEGQALDFASHLSSGLIFAITVFGRGAEFLDAVQNA